MEYPFNPQFRTRQHDEETVMGKNQREQPEQSGDSRGGEQHVREDKSPRERQTGTRRDLDDNGNGKGDGEDSEIIRNHYWKHWYNEKGGRKKVEEATKRRLAKIQKYKDKSKKWKKRYIELKGVVRSEIEKEKERRMQRQLEEDKNFRKQQETFDVFGRRVYH